MNGWLAFWTGLLVVGLFTYACLAVAVTVGGVLDIRKMFRALDEQHGVATKDMADRDRPSS